MPDYRQKRILVSWYADPRYIPPFVLSDRQVTVGTKSFPDQPAMMFAAFTPPGPHDLKAAVDAARIEGPFDAVVVWADASGLNLPLNLDAFNCPKVLCVGDTQHLKAPLKTMIGYAREARYDFIVSSHNRQHLHWFAEAGFAKTAWLPGLKVRHTPRPFNTSRKPVIAFVGNATEYHARRTRLLEALARAGVPVHATRAPREASADIFASSLASFNASLNGDLNLRVFEILSSGGCLFTDRLSLESGLSLLLEESKEFIGYDAIEECVAQARFLLRYPKLALDIAQAGRRAFTERMLPEQRANQLLSWVFAEHLDELFRAPCPNRGEADAPFAMRLHVYETLQELHRVVEEPKILFWNGLSEAYVRDALDLKRLKIFAGSFNNQPVCWNTMAVRKRCTPVERAQLEATHWDCILAPKGAPPPASIRSRHALAV